MLRKEKESGQFSASDFAGHHCIRVLSVPFEMAGGVFKFLCPQDIGGSDNWDVTLRDTDKLKPYSCPGAVAIENRGSLTVQQWPALSGSYRAHTYQDEQGGNTIHICAPRQLLFLDEKHWKSCL